MTNRPRVKLGAKYKSYNSKLNKIRARQTFVPSTCQAIEGLVERRKTKSFCFNNGGKFLKFQKRRRLNLYYILIYDCIDAFT